MSDKLNRRSFLEKGLLGAGALTFAAAGVSRPKAASAQDLFSQVNTAQNPHQLTPLEKKHVPEIALPKKVEAGKPFHVKITVNHVMQHRHFIQWIEIYDGELFLARVDFTAVKTRAQATVTLVLEKSTTLNVFERCNFHGLWKNSVSVEVV